MNNDSRLPNLFMVGAAKSGTLSMWHYLTQHPEIYRSPMKEPHYFSLPFFKWPLTGPGDERFNQTLPQRDLAVYKAYYKEADGYRYILDASPSYLYYQQSAERIREACPDAKILIMLRNPVDRAFSAYTFRRSQQWEKLSFKEALAMEDERIQSNYHYIWHYKRGSLYYEAVKHYLEVFGRENVKVVLLDDVKKDLQQTMNGIFEFLQLQPVSVKEGVMNRSGEIKHEKVYGVISSVIKSQGFLKRLIQRLTSKDFRRMVSRRIFYLFIRKATMDAEIRRELQNYYREDILKLQALLGRDLSCWLRDHANDSTEGKRIADAL